MHRSAAQICLLILLVGCKQQAATAPVPVQSLPASQLGCAKDTDCKGDRICDKSMCVAPLSRESSAQPIATPKPINKNPTPPAKASPDASREFEPGVNFGAVTSRTNEKDLIDLYGKTNVKREGWYLGEGQYRAASAVLKGTKDEFWLLWKNDKYAVPERAIALGSAWKTAEGLRVGLPLDSVVKINGRNFLFYGFEWDYGGAVESWERGKLSRFGDDLAVFLTRDFDVTADDATEESVLGDKSVLSSMSGLEQLQIKVHKIEAAL